MSNHIHLIWQVQKGFFKSVVGVSAAGLCGLAITNNSIGNAIQ
jgi:hypothetical protein